jgi:hypothetical protein
MTEGERLAEIAELLARGVQRLFVAEIKAESKPRNMQVPLDELAHVEAQCGFDVLNPKSLEHTR